MEPDWSEVSWIIRVNGIADAYLCWLTLDGWTLGHGSPAGGSLAVLTDDEDRQPTMADAQWLADVMAYDHDAPIDAAPRGTGYLGSIPKDPTVERPILPVSPLSLEHSIDYWENVRLAHVAAAENRFDASYTLRYDGTSGSPAPTSARDSATSAGAALSASTPWPRVRPT